MLSSRLTYRGVLDDEHWQAVVRLSLSAREFHVSPIKLHEVNAAILCKGTEIRDTVVPSLLSHFVDVSGYRSFANIIPSQWDRVASTVGVGYYETSLLHAVIADGREPSRKACTLGGLLNASVALYDYCIDERDDLSSTVESLGSAIIESLLDKPESAFVLLHSAYEEHDDPVLRLFICLVDAWLRGLRGLCTSQTDEKTWRNLLELLQLMYRAQHAIVCEDKIPGSLARCVYLVQARGVLPTLAMLELNLITSVASASREQDARCTASLLGRLIVEVDDVADLLADLRNGHQNAFIIQMCAKVRRDRRATLMDADLYEASARAAASIVDLIESLPDDLGLLNAETSHTGRRLSLTVREFGRLLVAGWIGGYDVVDTARANGFAGKLNETCEAAVSAILREQHTGYTEAIHNLNLPCLRSNGVQRETHGAILFQRAIILEALAEAASAGYRVPPEVLAQEIIGLLQSGHRHVRGGWNYLQDVSALPPDADDLGAVLLAITKAGGPSLACACDESIRLALDQALPDGGFPTWIIDPRGRTTYDAEVASYLHFLNAGGTHPEVVANLVCGLLKYDAGRFRDRILAANVYLAAHQESDGHWPSRWYAGPYYGTFKAVAALSATSLHRSCISRARSFLLNHQCADGSWEKSALSTAFALLALAMPAMGDSQVAIDAGLRFIRARQQIDGGWPAEPWIRFETSDGGVNYESGTLTTAYCLRALIACT